MSSAGGSAISSSACGSAPALGAESKRLRWPLALSRKRLAAACTARSRAARCCARLGPRQSRPPALMRISSDPFCRTLGSMRSVRSKMLLKGPFFCRSSMMARTGASPTPRIAPSPKATLRKRRLGVDGGSAVVAGCSLSAAGWRVFFPFWPLAFGSGAWASSNSSTTVNSTSLRFTLGGMSSSCIRRASSACSAMRSLLSISHESRAAMNSPG